MESISSPIRSISAYKLQDLVDICRKLEISDIKVVLGEFGSIVHQKKKTKQELYQEIVRAIT
jgi:DNA-binding cell septation regulator SpoVG